MKTTKTKKIESEKTEYKIGFKIVYDSTDVGGVMHDESFISYVEGNTYEEAVQKLQRIVFDDIEEKESNNKHYNGRCTYFSNPKLLSSRKASSRRTFVKRGKRKIEIIK